MTPPRDQNGRIDRSRIPTDTSALSDADIEQVYALPPIDDETIAIIGRLLRGTTTKRTHTANNE